MRKHLWPFLFLICAAVAFSADATFSSSAIAQQQQFDVCYYDASGAQHDADWCIVGGDLSLARNVNLSPHCRGNARAVCQLGNSGSCRPDSHKYNTYVIFKHYSGRCPTTYAEAIAGGQVVAPSCPAGFVFSGTQCVRDSAPVPSCPQGYVFDQGQCLLSSAAPPVPVPSVPMPQGEALFPVELQQNLIDLGCLVGGVDGVWGPASMSALQRFSNLPNSGLPRNSSEPTQAAFDATNARSAPRCPEVFTAPPPAPVQPPVRQVRCSQVKFGFTSGNTCACTDNRIFNGFECVRPLPTGGGTPSAPPSGQLPLCANAVNGICERTAFGSCQNNQNSACFDNAFAACQAQNGCR